MTFCLQAGQCEVRLAYNQDEIIQAQKLRYHVFYELMNAQPSEANALLKQDVDHFDDICDHLLVVDKTIPEQPRVVGNYRLLCAPYDTPADFFYSQQEYDLTPLIDNAYKEKMNMLELGRSCVHPDYRNNSILQLLWRGIMLYCREKNIGLMFGCASFSGTDLSQIQKHLAYLHQYRLADEDWRAKAHDACYENMQNDSLLQDYSEKTALAQMPPLIKGYLKLGAWIGDGAVVDKQFSTTDILIILPIARIKKRYFDFFTRSA